MDNLFAWIKNNQVKAVAIVFLVAAVAYTQLSKPRTYEDCLLQVVKEAKSDNSANIGRRACRAVFLRVLHLGWIYNPNQRRYD